MRNRLTRWKAFFARIVFLALFSPRNIVNRRSNLYFKGLCTWSPCSNSVKFIPRIETGMRRILGHNFCIYHLNRLTLLLHILTCALGNTQNNKMKIHYVIY